MKVQIREMDFDVQLPSLDLREDLVYSYGQKWKSNRTGMPLQRVCAAMVALCVPEVSFGMRLGANPREDLYSYGAEVYCLLRDRSWTAGDFLSAANQLLPLIMAETFPRESEVKKAAGN